MKKIILFGATGFLGSYLSEYLKKDYKLYQFGRSKKSDHNLDLLNKKCFFNKLERIKPDYLINLVAETNVDYCQKNKNCYEKKFCHC